MTRTPQAITAAAQSATQLQYLKRDVTGDGKPETFCNIWLVRALKDLGLSVPSMLANVLCDWFEGPHGISAGWRPVDAVTAQLRAESGFPTIATWANPSGHGHVALVVPSQRAVVGVAIAQAGSVNFTLGPLKRGFGKAAPKYFTHD